jgi:hypothetical protein
LEIFFNSILLSFFNIKYGNLGGKWKTHKKQNKLGFYFTSYISSCHFFKVNLKNALHQTRERCVQRSMKRLFHMFSIHSCQQKFWQLDHSTPGSPPYFEISEIPNF